jgi:hypothetical protein
MDERAVVANGEVDSPDDPVEAVHANGGLAESGPVADFVGVEGPFLILVVSFVVSGEENALVLNPVGVPGLDPGAGNNVGKKASAVKLRVQIELNGFGHRGSVVTHYTKILLLFILSR